MTPEVAVDLFREALWLTTMLVAILVVPSLICGLIVAIFQAATQINEQTLSFLPRLLVMLITLIVTGPWLLKVFMDYVLNLFNSIPTLIG
ncbi:flagellar biosynthesis protein FliQ [Pseudomonas sp. 21LCFQ02]|uniref:flagellar biosynthesis protein FliQ n=1 Tax=unclassified Pseudomonas TaxID=196821 RepID=UPI0004F852E0|nr:MULTISPECIES: flagellar biosynthesis protein FliQ [unclassified Pseudomonas]MCO8167351.1 flagellar biosynthesis protein FliQ [Pseudomonas sp. 21LCFQ02]MCQ9424934.1 flagellar biosynthesis protein FliQ [Pseudomonas sp. LJDD11]BAP44190.1 flagellar biosynthesis protein FliQ [Pseudomonas sp. StFLB209]